MQGAACSDLLSAYYCPSTEYACQGGRPRYNGTACLAEEMAAETCLAERAQPEPSCEKVCELQAAVCGGTHVEGCKQLCANVPLLGDCADEATAFYGCVAGVPVSGLVCDRGGVMPADGSCTVAFQSFVNCGG